MMAGLPWILLRIENKLLQKVSLFCGYFQLLSSQGIDLSHIANTDSSSGSFINVENKEKGAETMRYRWKSLRVRA